MEKAMPIRSKTTEMVINKCRYIVTAHYNEAGRETAEDKLFRLVSNRISSEMKNSERLAFTGNIHSL